MVNLGRAGNMTDSPNSWLRDSVLGSIFGEERKQLAFDIFGYASSIMGLVGSAGASAWASAVSAEATAAGQIVRAVLVEEGKVGVSVLGGYLGGKASGWAATDIFGADANTARYVEVIGGIAAGWGTYKGANALDRRFNWNGLNPPKVLQIQNPDSLKQQGIIDAVESGKTPLENTLQKGNYGEMKMDQLFESNGYERVSTDRITSLDAPTHQGIDGVYYSEGPPPMYAIAEAKYGTSTLSMTNDGLQMSDSWLAGHDRLLQAVGLEQVDAIARVGYTKYLIQIQPDGTVVPTILP